MTVRPRLCRPFWSEINTLLGSMGYMMKGLGFPLLLGDNIRVGVVFSQLSASPHIKHISEKDVKLAQKLGQLQPFIAVFLQQSMGQLGSFGPT